MLLFGTDPESYITEETIGYEEEHGKSVSCCPFGMRGGFASDISLVKSSFVPIWWILFAPFELMTHRFEPFD